MKREEAELIRRALRHQNPPREVTLALERLGDPALDAIIEAIRVAAALARRRDESRIANGLRRLALLTRQACFGRKEEVLILAIELSASPNKRVRSAAVNSAIWLTHLLEAGTPRARSARFKPGAMPSMRQQVQDAVAKALVAGLDQNMIAFAEDFIANKF